MNGAPQAQRDALYQLLGDLPARSAPPHAVKLNEVAQADYVV